MQRLGTVMLSVNTSWNVVNFRAGLIRALRERGYDVVVVAPSDGFSDSIARMGCRYLPFSLDGQSRNVLHDLALIGRYAALIRREKPDVFLAFTIKPNIYGTVACALTGVPTVNNITGLGSAFGSSGWLSRLVTVLYRVALSRASTVFFQNADDRELFLKHAIVPLHLTDTVPGSGVDTQAFAPIPLPNRDRVRFLLMGRLLRSKGVHEFADAARQLRNAGIKAECCLIGAPAMGNPDAVPESQLTDWIDEGILTYGGWRDDVRPEIAEADCVVLPSYREGAPRALLEAAAMARPIVTTDSPGCRDVVRHEYNGLLCRPRDPENLAQCMARIASMSAAERRAMGMRGRGLIEQHFDERLVIAKYLDAVTRALTQASTGRVVPSTP